MTGREIISDALSRLAAAGEPIRARAATPCTVDRQVPFAPLSWSAAIAMRAVEHLTTPPATPTIHNETGLSWRSVAAPSVKAPPSCLPYRTMKVAFLSKTSPVVRGMRVGLSQRGIEVVDDDVAADVLISSGVPELLHHPVAAGQRLLLWTNEPRWSSQVQRSAVMGDRTIEVMNCHTGDVYVDAFHYLWAARYRQLDPMTGPEYDARAEQAGVRCAYFMASNHGDGKPFVINGLDIDLYRLRDEFALLGHRLGLVDIYGQGWPEGVAIQESREGKAWDDWEQIKLAVGKKYKYSICIENTNGRNYVTEKFWHAIMCRTVPVYYVGTTGIDHVFDVADIVDVTQAGDFESVYARLKSIDKQEYLGMVNSLVNRFNVIAGDPSILKESREKMLACVAARIVDGA